MTKEILFSVTRKDCEWDYFSGSGAGGQHRNKHKNCVRVYHPPSGARGMCQDYREKGKNEKEAFNRMAKSDIMQKWLRLESAKYVGSLKTIEEKVDDLMQEKNLRVEKKENGKWVKYTSEYDS
jgi:protein subunit release factor B